MRLSYVVRGQNMDSQNRVQVVEQQRLAQYWPDKDGLHTSDPKINKLRVFTNCVFILLMLLEVHSTHSV